MRKTCKLLLLIFGLFSASCDDSSYCSAISNEDIAGILAELDYEILEFKTEYNGLFSSYSSVKGDTLTNIEIGQIELIIYDYFKKRKVFDSKNELCPEEGLTEYYRQYIAVDTGIGKVVYINAFIGSHKSNGYDKLIEDFDGGSISFQVIVELSRKRIFGGVKFNGNS